MPTDPASPFPTGPRIGYLDRAVMFLLDRELAKDPPTPPSDAVGELYNRAPDPSSAEEEYDLLSQALELDPGDAELLLEMLEYLPLLTDGEVEVLRRIVAIAARRLGPEVLQDNSGGFWDLPEGQAYLQAREALAAALVDADALDAAVSEWEAMLELDADDHLGMRYHLLSGYLALVRMDRAAALFEQFEEETGCCTMFLWSRVLERWLADDEPGADAALALAREQNPHTEAYLKGRRRLPEEVPEEFPPGSRSEAEVFAAVLRIAWDSHPDALDWLDARSPAKPSAGPLAKKKKIRHGGRR